MQTATGNILSADRPFEWQGASVYAGTGQPRYRKPRVVSGRLTPMRSRFRGTKTARIAFEAGTGELEIAATLPTELTDNPNVAINVRPYRDDCECEVDGGQVLAIDSAGDEEEAIAGRAVLIATETRTAGSVRFVWRFIRGQGTPYRFRMARLTGPTSPTAVTVRYAAPGLYEATFTGLSASAYTFRLTAENEAGTVTQTLLDDIPATPVTAGPPAVTSLTAEVR